MSRALFVASCLLVASCGGSDGNTVPDAGPSLVDTGARTDLTSSGEDLGVAPDGSPAADQGVPRPDTDVKADVAADLLPLPDSASPDTAPVIDSAVTEDSAVTDAAGDAAADAAQPVDAQVTDAPGAQDAPADAPVGEGSLTSDAGKYLCLTKAGDAVPCECNDGIDNDGDGKTDYPNDTGCIEPWDHSEAVGATQCTDGVDNDGDGTIDMEDPECTGPLDNDESTYGTGHPGDGDPCHRDCFFDGNTTSADDKCEWSFKCDPLSPGQYLEHQCLYDPSFSGCPASQPYECYVRCLFYTPNGCDCFGCCALDEDNPQKTVLLVESCTPENLDDPALCPPCTQSVDCINPCDPCEVCIGRPLPSPGCYTGHDGGPSSGDGGAVSSDGGGTVSDGGGSTPLDAGAGADTGGTSPCPPGVVYCGPGGVSPSQCPSQTFCISGCCLGFDFPL